MKHSSGQFLLVSLVLSCSLTLQFRCLLFFCGPHPLSTPTSYQVTLFIQSCLSSFCAYNSPGNYNYSPGCSSVKIPFWAVLTLFRDWGRERKLSSHGVAVSSVMLILILSHLTMQVPVFWPTLFFIWGAIVFCGLHMGNQKCHFTDPEREPLLFEISSWSMKCLWLRREQGK